MTYDIVTGTELDLKPKSLWVLVYYAQGSNYPYTTTNTNEDDIRRIASFLIRDESRPLKLYKLEL